jgi:hypothetical protein
MDYAEGFMEKILVPAVSPMSTEHQQYSFANQADAIARSATEHGFQIVRTYSDGKKRPAVSRLLCWAARRGASH